MRVMNIMKFVFCLFAIAALVGCGSILGKSGPETLNIRSTPDQATIMIMDETGTKIFEGKTPTTVSLEKKKGYFSGKKYTVKIAKENYAEYSSTVDTRASGWYLGGNLIFGGLIGWLIVDPATGGMWTLDTNEISTTLEPVKSSKQTDSLQIGVVSLSDIPISLRSKLVKVTQ